MPPTPQWFRNKGRGDKANVKSVKADELGKIYMGGFFFFLVLFLHLSCEFEIIFKQS